MEGFERTCMTQGCLGLQNDASFEGPMISGVGPAGWCPHRAFYLLVWSAQSRGRYLPLPTCFVSIRKNQPKNVGTYRAYIYIYTIHGMGEIFVFLGEGGLGKLRPCFFFKFAIRFFGAKGVFLGKNMSINIHIFIHHKEREREVYVYIYMYECIYL